MKTLRLFFVLAAMLLSSGIANAQTETVPGDVNKDGIVNAADIAAVVDIIMENRYFGLSVDPITYGNYNTFSGVETAYESIDVVLKNTLKVSVPADKQIFILCPDTWDAVKDLVFQDEAANIYALTENTDSKIANHKVYTTDKFTAATEVTLKTKEAAEEAKKAEEERKKAEEEAKKAAEEAKASYATSDGPSDGIKFKFINKTGAYICFSGKFKMYIKQGDSQNWSSDASQEKELEAHLNAPDYTGDGWPHWYKNNYELGPDETKEFTLKQIVAYQGNGTSVQTVTTSLDTYTDGSWYFMSVDKYNNGAVAIPAVKLGHAAWNRSTNELSNSAFLVHVSPVKASDCCVQKGKTYNLIIDSADTNDDEWNCGGNSPTTPTTPTTPVTPGTVDVSSQAVYTGQSGVTFVIKNSLSVEARFTGKAILNLSKNPNDWDNSIQVDANMHGPNDGTSWGFNDIIIPAGGSYQWNLSSIQYNGANIIDGGWYFMNSDRSEYVHTIYLYCREYSKSRGKDEGSNHMYTAAPLQNTKLQNGYTYYLSLNWINPDASLAPDTSGNKYIILGYKQADL